MQNDSPPNILYYLDFYWNQTDLDFILQNYSQLRHFHHNPERSYPLTIICNEIAKGINATLVAKVDNSHIINPGQGHQYPTIMPLMDTIEIEEKTPFFYWQHELIKTSSFENNGAHHEFPTFVSRITYHFNFAYCDVPKKLKESMWAFYVFTQPFDHWTWILLLFSLLAVGTVFSLNSIKLLDALLSAFSSLLSSSIGTPTLPTKLRYSFLFILWTLQSLFIIVSHLPRLNGIYNNYSNYEIAKSGTLDEVIFENVLLF